MRLPIAKFERALIHFHFTNTDQDKDGADLLITTCKWVMEKSETRLTCHRRRKDLESKSSVDNTKLLTALVGASTEIKIKQSY